jgi:hypothetical protein
MYKLGIINGAVNEIGVLRYKNTLGLNASIDI